MATTETTALKPHPVWSALVGLASLGVLLQGLWAGLFLRRGAANRDTWVSIHQHAGEATVLIVLLATVAAVIWMRQRRDVLLGTVLFLVLVVIELVLGYTIEGSTSAVAVHVPLALLIMGLAVWLPLAARRPAPAAVRR
jgi:heme A synthase